MHTSKTLWASTGSSTPRAVQPTCGNAVVTLCVGTAPLMGKAQCPASYRKMARRGWNRKSREVMLQCSVFSRLQDLAKFIVCSTYFPPAVPHLLIEYQVVNKTMRSKTDDAPQRLPLSSDRSSHLTKLAADLIISNLLPDSSCLISKQLYSHSLEPMLTSTASWAIFFRPVAEMSG